MTFSKKTWTNNDKPTVEDFNRLENGIFEALSLLGALSDFDIRIGRETIDTSSATSNECNSFEKDINYGEDFSFDNNPIVICNAETNGPVGVNSSGAKTAVQASPKGSRFVSKSGFTLTLVRDHSPSEVTSVVWVAIAPKKA